MKSLDKEIDNQIIYCDNHILVACKKANMLTQPSPIEAFSLQSECQNWIKKTWQKQKNVFLHPVHRLDKKVSGIVLFARTSKSLSRLQKMLKMRNIHREYIALVEGKIEKKKQKLTHYLVHNNFYAQVVAADHPLAKEAVLEYETIAYYSTYSLVKIILHTGRYHQIRAQMQAIHHPIVGDKKYHTKTIASQIYLHHFRLRFMHPISHRYVEISVLPHWLNSLLPYSNG